MPSRPKSAAAAAAQTPANVFIQAFSNSPAMETVTRISDRVLVEANDAFLTTLGYTREEVVGRSALEMDVWVTPEKSQGFRDELASKGFVRGFEIDIRTKQGGIRTVLLSADIMDVNGEPHVVAAGVDITERKAMEARLREGEQRVRESEALFSTAFKSSPVFMTIATLHDGRFVEVNDAFLSTLQLTRAETIGRNSVELGLWFSLEDRDQFHAETKRAGRVRNVECRIRRRDGGVRIMQISAEIVEINRVPHMLTFGIDVTERKQAEADLRDSEQRLRESEAQTSALYAGISTAVVVQDETGFLLANPAALRLIGATDATDFIGKRPETFSMPVQPGGEDSAVLARQHVARAFAEGRAQFEWMARKLDGTPVPVEVTLTTIQLGGRTVIQSVIIDQTERKRIEIEQQRALQRERELSQLKSDFVALVSHEFRTPLEIIMSSVDNLDRYHERLPAEKRQQLLRTINKSVRRMSGMMEEVLLLGRLDSGGTEYKPAKLDLAGFCQRLCDEMASATGQRCPIALHAEGELSAARGDEAVLRHILTNLLSNAVKYSAPGQPVELSVRREGANAIVAVKDRGCGIPADDQKRLFQAFHRASNVRQFPGTGLGLLIVRRCVDLHQGEIAFESTEGRGTTFTVRLPLFTTAKTRGKAAVTAKKRPRAARK